MALGEVSDAGIADARDIHRLLYAELHIGLAACQIYVTHQNIGEGDGFVIEGDGHLVGTAGFHSGKVNQPAVGGLEGDGVAAKFYATLTGAATEYRNGFTAL